MESANRNTTTKAGVSRRAVWFISILFALGLMAAVLSAYYLIKESRDTLERELAITFNTAAQNKVADITVWYGTLKNQANQFASTDVFRLFTTEMYQLRDELTLSPQAQPQVGRGRTDNAVQITGKIPLVRNQLRKFVASSGILAASVLDMAGNIYVSSNPELTPLTPEESKALREVMRTGHSIVLPVRASEGGLIANMLQPVFAPAYLDIPATSPVGVLLLHVPVDDFAKSLCTGDTRLLQWGLDKNQPLQEILPASNDVRPLPGWYLDEMGRLPLALRSLPDEDSVYALGLPVPGLPLVVTEAQSAESTENALKLQREKILMFTGGATLIFILFLGLVWWWLIGRSERAVNKRLTELFKTVHAQKQILDGINSTLSDGILLLDLESRVTYANPAMAALAGHTVESMQSLNADTLFTFETPTQIKEFRQKAISLETAQVFTEKLWQNNQQRYYHVVCSPFLDENDVITGTVSVFHDITAMVLAQKNSQRMIRQTINVLMRAIEAADPYLCGQSAQTGQLATMLAKRMLLSQRDQDTVRTAAALCQIGMLRLPESLRAKRGLLTPEERSQMQMHVEHAASLLADFDFGLPVREAIVQMHERLDGSGYPAHLHGEQIGLHARILAVASVFCAMLRPRSYRTAQTVEHALEALSVVPAQFDPEVVHILHDFLDTDAGNRFLEELRSKDR